MATLTFSDKDDFKDYLDKKGLDLDVDSVYFDTVTIYEDKDCMVFEWEFEGEKFKGFAEIIDWVVELSEDDIPEECLDEFMDENV